MATRLLERGAPWTVINGNDKKAARIHALYQAVQANADFRPFLLPPIPRASILVGRPPEDQPSP